MFSISQDRYCLPSLVKDFILTSEFETEYFYIVMTYGMHHGGCAARNAEFLEKEGKHTKADLKENLVLVQKRYWIILVLRRLDLESKGYKQEVISFSSHHNRKFDGFRCNKNATKTKSLHYRCINSGKTLLQRNKL